MSAAGRREHAGDRRVERPQPVGQFGPHPGLQPEHGRAVAGQGLGQRGSVLAVLAEQQPGALERSRAGIGDRLPGDAVAPAVDLGPLATACPPGRQRGQHGGHGLGVDAQLGCERGEIALLDGVPEAGLHRLRGAGGAAARSQYRCRWKAYVGSVDLPTPR